MRADRLGLNYAVDNEQGTDALATTRWQGRFGNDALANYAVDHVGNYA